MYDFEKNISSILEQIEILKINVAEFDKNKRRNSGIICPKCGSGKNYVTNTRKNSGFLIRTRECKECGHRWNTEEIISNKSCRKK